ncbi:MAG: hypothetical protein ACR2JI_10940 [Mycobacterium sp.]
MSESAVDVAGLYRLAGRYRTWSDDLAEPTMPTESAPGLRSAVAAAEVQRGLAAASEALAARMRQTAAALVDAADAYRATDTDSATALRHLLEASWDGF